jgi:CxxC motif-containing protein
MANLKGNQTTSLKSFLSFNFTNFNLQRDKFSKNVQYIINLESVNKLDAMTKIMVDGGFRNVHVIVKNPIEKSMLNACKEYLSKRGIECPVTYHDTIQLQHETEWNERYAQNSNFMNCVGA